MTHTTYFGNEQEIEKMASVAKAATALANACILNEIKPDDIINIVKAIAEKKINNYISQKANGIDTPILQ